LTLVSLSLRLKDLLGPVTRVKKKKKSMLQEVFFFFFFFFITPKPRVE